MKRALRSRRSPVRQFQNESGWYRPALMSGRIEALETRSLLTSGSYAAALSLWSASDAAALEQTADSAAWQSWIVQLTPAATASVRSLSDVSALLSRPDQAAHAVQGLSRPGLVRVRIPAAGENAIRQALTSLAAVQSFERDTTVTGQLIPSDPSFVDQIDLRNTGANGTLPDADIDAEEAWDITTGSASIVVAVIDSGVDYRHPDLYLNIWLNPGELPAALQSSLVDTNGDGRITFRDLNAPANAAFVSDLNATGYIDAGDLLADSRWENGIDEDSNGRTDDLIGWDFRQNDNDPLDTHGHGTHVAGTIGAVGNNGTGIAGLNWQTQIMPLRFLDSVPGQGLSGSTGDAISAIHYTTDLVTDRGINVRVSNNSWGSLGTFSTTLREAIAENGQAGVLFVAAAGNGEGSTGRGIDLDETGVGFFPASFDLDHIIAVAATDLNDNLAVFSQFGPVSIDIAAPGVAVLSTDLQQGFSIRNGTSMATPHVAGAAALILSRVPEASPQEVRRALMESVDAKAALSGRVASGGRLNARRALDVDTVAPRATLLAAPTVTADGGTSYEFQVRYRDNQDVDFFSLDNSDVLVRPLATPEAQLSAVISNLVLDSDPNTPGSQPIVTYRITPPGGTWTRDDNGDYRIELAADAVADIRSGTPNRTRAALLGSFEVDIENVGQINVATFADGADANPADGISATSEGVSTLRAAIQTANAIAGLNTLVLEPGTYVLNITGSGEDSGATGDLDITDDLLIIGNGATIQVNGISDRVLDIFSGANVELRDVMITGGSLSDPGGGLRNSGHLTITGSTIYDNAASSGGGIASSSGSVTLINSTVSGNTATNGGGVSITDGSLTLRQVTVAANHVSGQGGGLRQSGAATVSLVNTLVATNTSETSSPDIAGAVGSATHSLIGIGDGSTGVTHGVSGNQVGSSGSPLDPVLGPLQNNTGSTLTHALRTGSPAIDTASLAETTSRDQRGVLRPVDADTDTTPEPDIGAVERYFGEIAGVVFRDDNGDGLQQLSEPGLPGLEVFLDQNSNGIRDIGETTALTGTDGGYEFPLLPPGRYQIALTPPAGLESTSPVYDDGENVLDLVELRPVAGGNGSDGFVLNSSVSGSRLGNVVASVGDPLGQGRSSVLIASVHQSVSYLVHGGIAGELPAEFSAETLVNDSSRVTSLSHENQTIRFGGTVGDLNSDSRDELIISLGDSLPDESSEGATLIIGLNDEPSQSGDLILPAGVVLKTIDINPGAGNSQPREMVNVNGILFFVADDGVNGFELWKSDGTSGGTAIVKDILQGTYSSGATSLVNVNGTLFFRANDGTYGYELWKSDGTASGTTLVKDIRAGAAPSGPRDLTNVGGILFFLAHDLTHGYELWKSDGTESGTVLVKDVRPGSISNDARNLTNVGGTLFFAANDGTYGSELWISDGTEAGTVLVKDIAAGAGSANPAALTAVGETLFFSASDSAHGVELWKSDGTVEGTHLIRDIRPGPDSSLPTNLVNVNGALFFGSNDGTSGRELWKSDGSESGTSLIRDIRPGVGDGFSTGGAVLDGIFYFTANDGTFGKELWKSDGTVNGTSLVKDFLPGPRGSQPGNAVNVNGTLLILAFDESRYAAFPTSEYALWRSDGTTAGTTMVLEDLTLSGGSIAGVGNNAYLSVSIGASGRELLRVDPLAVLSLTDSRATDSFVTGDFDGDGKRDLALGSAFHESIGRPESGRVSIIFGMDDVPDSGTFTFAELETLLPGRVLHIPGRFSGDELGTQLASGDFNGDGFDELLMLAPGAFRNSRTAGEAYLLFGRAEFPDTIDLSTLTGSDGVILQSASTPVLTGIVEGSLPDLNGDGLSDLVIATSDGSSRSSVVITGRLAGFSQPVFTLPEQSNPALGTLVLSSPGSGQILPVTLTSAGDFNGDGVSDLLIGDPFASLPGVQNAGKGYLIFGDEDLESSDALSELDAFGSEFIDVVDGLLLTGIGRDDRATSTVTGISDFNGDGFDDVAIAAPQANSSAGQVYVVYGRPDPELRPRDEHYLVDLRPGGSVTGADFGNRPEPATLRGTVVRDLNANGVREAGEFGLAGFDVYLDLDNSGTRTPNEPLAMTDASGDYVFANVAPLVTYTIRQLDEEGFNRTFPDSGFLTVTPQPGQEIIGLDFGNVDLVGGVGLGTGELRGRVFTDSNRNGRFDAGETGFSGVTVFLDLNDNGLLDDTPSMEPRFTTLLDDPGTAENETGLYVFDTLAERDYVVRTLLPEEMEQTSPAIGSFTTASVSAGQGPAAAVPVFYNDDAFPDLIVVTAGRHDILVQLNNGDGTFAPGVSIAAPSVLSRLADPRSIKAADFNGDGRTDLVIGNNSFNRPAVLLDNGAGGYTAVTMPALGSFDASSVAIGHFNHGDSFPDIAVASEFGDRVYILINNGEGSFTLRETLTPGDAPVDLLAVDLDNDGDSDLVVANRNDATLRTFLLQSNDVFLTANLGGLYSKATGLGPYRLTSGDFDGDGFEDVAVANVFDQRISIFINRQTGAFFDAQQVRAGNRPASITAGDFNGDGLVDLAVATLSESGFTVLLNLGAGRFQAPSASGVASLIDRLGPVLIAADINGDQTADLLRLQPERDGGQLIAARNAPQAGTFRVSIQGGDSIDNLHFGMASPVLPTQISLDGSGQLLIQGLLSEPGNNERLSLSVSDGQLVITDTDIPLATTVGTAVSDFEVRVPLALITANQVRVNTAAGDDRVNAVGVSLATLGLILEGGSGNDTLTGGTGFDRLIGGGGDDSLNGSDGNDVLIGEEGQDTLAGGAGFDIVDEIQDFSITLAGNSTTASLTFAQTTGTIVATEMLTGIEAASLRGGASANRLDASGWTSSSITTLIGGGGRDTVIGSPGRDRITTFSSGRDSIQGGAGNDTIASGNGDDTIDGGEGNDSIQGQGGNDSITGSIGDDNLAGSDGNDTLLGQDGLDKLFGSTGNDSLLGGNDNDSLFGESGDDTLRGEAGRDLLRGSTGIDSMDGGAGIDRIDEAINADVTIVGVQIQSAVLGNETPVSIERIVLTGGTGGNLFNARLATVEVQLTGNGGNDTLIGGSANDTVRGNDGDDVLTGSGGTDVVEGGAGFDVWFESANANFTVSGLQVSSTSTGTETGIDIERIALEGGVGNNNLNASAASVPVLLLGGLGNDTLLGGSGNDTLTGGFRGDTTVAGSDGIDSLDGGAGTDTLKNDPSDTLSNTDGDTLLSDVFSLLPDWLDLI